MKTRFARQSLLLVSVLLLTLLGYSSLRFKKTPKLPSVESTPSYSKSFSHVWTSNRVVMLAMGDSIAAGTGMPPGKSFYERLIDNSSDPRPAFRSLSLGRVLPGLTTYNLAVPGSNSADLIDQQLPLVRTNSLDNFGLIVVTIGGNDLIGSRGAYPPRDGSLFGADVSQARPWIAAFEKRIDRFLSEIPHRFPGGCHVFLANIYDPTDGSGLLDSSIPRWEAGCTILGLYNNVLKQCSERFSFVTFVDIHTQFYGHGISSKIEGERSFWFGQPIQDPNERGHENLYMLFLEMITHFAERKWEFSRPLSITRQPLLFFCSGSECWNFMSQSPFDYN